MERLLEAVMMFIFVFIMIISTTYIKQLKVDDENYHISVNYENGVYYFPYTENSFGTELSKFVKNNPGVEISAITCNEKSCFVIVSQKKISAKQEDKH